MARPAVLSVRIIGDAASGVDAMVKMETASGKMMSAVDKASIGAGIALAALAAAAKQVGDAAAEAEQAAGAVDSVFGEYAGNVHAYAEEAALAVGLAKDQYGQLAAVIGAQLGNMGVAQDQLSGQTADLITMGADLAATFGGTTADAVGALSSLLRGERDPIERYGVSIKAVDIEAQKAAMGLDGLTGEADTAATTQATLALLMEQTAKAQGQFASEADTAAGAQERANAMWRNAQIELGENLLPIMTEGAKIAAEFAGWVSENSEVVMILAGVIGGLSAGILVINGAMKAYAAIQAIQTAAQWANNAAWLASPVTLIVLAVTAAVLALATIIVLIIKHWDELEAAAVQVGQTIADVFDSIIGWVQDVLGWLGRLASNIMPSWLKDLVGIQSFSIGVDTPAELPSARMMFTASETMAAFAQPPALKSTAAPRIGFPDARGGGGDSYDVHITFSGLVTDERAVAREIRDILSTDALRSGRRRPEEALTW